MTDLNELSAQEIGRRLRVAREIKGVRQDEAAQVISVSRPTLVAIEQGSRRVRISELQQLARHYGTSVNALLRREAVHTDLLPRFRKLRDTENADTANAVRLLNDLIKAEIELENVLGLPQHRNYPPERGINEGDVSVLAETHAQELRDWLGLGPGPIADIFSVIELNLGIRLFQRKLPAGIAGLFTYDDDVGACMLLNANHPRPRRTQSAAHELGHFYGTRRNPEVLEENEKFLSRDEKYAHAFGQAFLAPRDSFSESFRQLKDINQKITRRLIILLAHHFGLSRQACTLRLEQLGLAKKGTWQWFENNGGITKDNVREVLGDVSEAPDLGKVDGQSLLPHRMSLMAYRAWKQELMSEGQLAELLKVGRVELRELIDQIAIEDRQGDELGELLG